MDAAMTHLSEEVLYRTPKESYDKFLWEEEQAEGRRTLMVHEDGKGRSCERIGSGSLIHEWQTLRKELSGSK